MYLTFFSFEYYNCLTWTIFEKTNITCIAAVTMSNATNATMITASTHCPSSAVTISLTMLVFVTGVLGNAIVIAYVRRERRAKKKPNIVLLFQMALNNLLALCTSLPLHLILAELVPTAILPMRLGNMLCAIRPLSSYVFVKVGLLTLTGICVDRYEMFTRLRKPKTLTAEFTKKFVVASWLTAFATSTCVCYGYIQKALRPQAYCKHHPDLDKQQQTVHEKISNALVVLDLAIWILACNFTIVYTLLKVWHALRKHFDAVKSTLGHSKVLREMRLVKMAAYVFAAYALLWLPYGVSRILLLTLGGKHGVIECFYEVYKTITYTIFAAIPFIYIRTNNKILRHTLRMLGRPVQRLRPHSIVLVAWSTIGRNKSKAENSVTSAAVESSFSVEI